jgi:hypothetical protein
MHFAQAATELKELENAPPLRFVTKARTSLCAFSNESFSLVSFDPNNNRLQFADDTGRSELEYELRFFASDAIRNITEGATK